MKAQDSGRVPLSSAISQLYGYIWCMLVSSTLTDLPLYGGALYLFGRAVIAWAAVYGKKNRGSLPGYGKRWGLVLMVALGVVSVALIGLYPATIESSRLWLLYGATALYLFADTMTIRFLRLKEEGIALSRRVVALGIALQLAVIGALLWLFVYHLGWQRGGPLCAGFALLTLLRGHSAVAIETVDRARPASPAPEEDIRSVPAYRSFEWVSLALTASVELLLALIYALLAVRPEQLFPAVLIAMICTILPAMGCQFYLTWTRKQRMKDPTRIMLAGILLCTAGAILCVWMLSNRRMDYVRIYLCLSLCSFGGMLCLSGVARIETVIPDVAQMTGKPLPEGYGKIRRANYELARLLGDTLALIALSLFFFGTRKQLPRDMEQLAARFQPVMAVPLLLVGVGALISVLQFPLSARYIRKLKLFLAWQRKGEDRPALKKQLDHVLTGRYRQPFLTWFLMALLRPLFRYKMIDADHIVEDDNNPLLLVGNHGEIFGPIVAALCFPIHVRFWTVSTMMGDEKVVTDYLYTNTYSRVTWLPVWGRKALAHLIGWLSVRVMDQMENIPVYRDSPMKLRETFRRSIEALEAGDNLMIFPEATDQKYKMEGIGKLAPGFVLLASAYWRKTGKRLRMLPTYSSKEDKTVTFGQIITFDPEIPFAEEQARIIAETEAQILRMAGE